MLASYLKTALRFFRRQKAYASINILGLAIGLVCSFLILLWIQHERSYDRFHAQGDLLFNVMRRHYANDEINTWFATPFPLAQVLKETFPEIEETVLTLGQTDRLLSQGDRMLRTRGQYVSPAFFQMFSFPLRRGDAATVLDDPSSIVLSEAAAESLFGEEDPIGKDVTVDQERDLTVTGVFANVPDNSSLQFDFIIPVQGLIERNTSYQHWGNNNFRLFVRLQEGEDSRVVSRKIKNVLRAHNEVANADLFLHPFLDSYLYSKFENGQLVGGRITYVRIFSLIAFFILLIAAINFMNLATARSAQRAREIGVRKAVGATRTSLIGQFLAESVLMALVAFVVACCLVVLALPAFNEVTGKHFSVDALQPATWLFFLVVALVTGVLAGSYPAFYLASFNIIRILRGGRMVRTDGGGVRKALVVFQFALSTLLIVGVLTIYAQMHFIQTKHLGMDREHLVYVTLEDGIGDRFDAFKQELLQQRSIVSVTRASQSPLSVGSWTTDPSWPGKAADRQVPFYYIDADYDFVETMQLEMAAGRSFSREIATHARAYLINEAAARAMGVEDPVGMPLTFWGREGEVVGVVKDFHMASLYTEIKPTIIRFYPPYAWMLFARLEPGQTSEALAAMKRVYERFNPAYPFEYRFLDAQYEQMYQSDQVAGTLATYFAALAVFIACLGLFGLAAYTAEQRTKEIGIRKVLGATVPGLVALLSRDFGRLVLVAFVLASPVAYFVMQRWLADFAYRVDLGWSMFALAGVLVLSIAFITVSYHAVRAALADPVNALRYE